jgi:hypothetical protein
MLVVDWKPRHPHIPPDGGACPEATRGPCAGGRPFAWPKRSSSPPSGRGFRVVRAGKHETAPLPWCDTVADATPSAKRRSCRRRVLVIALSAGPRRLRVRHGSRSRASWRLRFGHLGSLGVLGQSLSHAWIRRETRGASSWTSGTGSGESRTPAQKPTTQRSGTKELEAHSAVDAPDPVGGIPRVSDP